MNGGSDDLERRFSHHRPDAKRVIIHQQVRSACLELATLLTELVPTSDELDIAIERLEEVMFWSNAAVARADSSEDGEEFE